MMTKTLGCVLAIVLCLICVPIAWTNEELVNREEPLSDEETFDAQTVLNQLHTAEITSRYDTNKEDNLRVLKSQNELDILNMLATYGFRPQPYIGLKFIAKTNEQNPDEVEYFFLAAHNSVGLELSVLRLSDEWHSAVKPYSQRDPQITYDGSLNLYEWVPFCASCKPKGSNIKLIKGVLRYDSKTGLISSAVQ